jgi:hypothetical protein
MQPGSSRKHAPLRADVEGEPEACGPTGPKQPVCCQITTQHWVHDSSQGICIPITSVTDDSRLADS